MRLYGADAVFDYKASGCADEIRNYTAKSLGYVLDCVSEPETMQFCYECIGRAGGKYTALEPYPESLHTRRNTVVPDWVLGPTVLGKRLGWPQPFAREPSEKQREFGREWFATAQDLLDSGMLKPHPLQLVPNGLEGVFYGLEQLKLKKVSGEKLVCRIQPPTCDDMDRVLAEETTPSGKKRYLVSYSGQDAGSHWVEVENLQGKPQILHDWYKMKWWTT